MQALEDFLSFACGQKKYLPHFLCCLGFKVANSLSAFPTLPTTWQI
jgi:hypothetical protein